MKFHHLQLMKLEVILLNYPCRDRQVPQESLSYVKTENVNHTIK